MLNETRINFTNLLSFKYFHWYEKDSISTQDGMFFLFRKSRQKKCGKCIDTIYEFIRDLVLDMFNSAFFQQIILLR